MDRQEFLAAAAACDIHTSYYTLCDSHPVRSSLPSISTSGKDLLAAISGEISVEKLRGPGSVYRLLSLPEGVELNVIIQQRTTVETHFSVSSGETMETGTFAILSREIVESRGEPTRSPAYPRPTFHSVEELIAILGSFERLMRKIAAVA